MSEPLTRENFDPYVDKVFRVRNGRHALTLTGIDWRPIEESERAMGLRAPFNLIFRGPPGDVLNEGMHLLETEDGTCFDLYVIPIHTAARDRQDYQSSFN